MHPCPLQAVPLSWSSLGQETLGILKWASITQAAPSPGTKLPVGAAQAGCVNINKINGSLVFTLLLLLLTVVLDSVDLGPGALAATGQQELVHLFALLEYLTEARFLVVQTNRPWCLHLDQVLGDEVVLLDIVVWVITGREQTLTPVCRDGNQVALSHLDVRQLGEGVVQAQIITFSECFDQQYLGTSDLLLWSNTGPPLKYVPTAFSELYMYPSFLISLRSKGGIFLGPPCIFSKNPSSQADVAWRLKHRFLAKFWHKNDVFDEKKGVFGLWIFLIIICP